MKKMFEKKVSGLRTMLALTFAATLLSAGAQAATYYVTPTGAGVGDGKSWGSATGNIQKAIDSCAANGGGEVWVKAGTYKPSATVTWKQGVNVYGGFAGTETGKSQRSLDATLTVLDGDAARFVAQKGNDHTNYTKQTTWSGLTLHNGRSTYTGGIYLYPNMTLDNVVISNCVATNTGNSGGGAISVTVSTESNDTAIVRNCRIVGNTANYGGGICIGNPSNTGDPVKSHVLIENTEIINNKATTRGGGIAIEPKAGSTKDIIIRNCLIANNSSANNSGGGISLFRADAQIINTTFANNIAGNWGGGGLYANSVDSLTVLNCIFWNNEDTQNGTGSHTILSQGKGAKDSVVVIRNSAFAPALQVGTDVASNTALTVADTINVDVQNSGSVVGVKYINFSRPSVAAGYAAADADKLNADWSLAQGSAAIDAGAIIAGIAADIAGRSRPVGSKPDIGAYEYAEPLAIAAGATVSTDYTASHGDVIFEANATTGAGQWTAANATVTNGAVKLVRTFETNKSYAIGFPFAVASVSVADYELQYYDGEANLFGAAAAIEAGKGYLIKFPAPRDTTITVTFTSVRNPTLATPAALGADEYALLVNPTLKNAADVASAQNYYLYNSGTGAFGTPTATLGALKPFEAVLATAATANLLTADTIGKGNAATPTVTLTADSGITVLTPEGITYPYQTIDPFVATFKVAAGYTNVRAIVAVPGETKIDTIALTPVSNIYTVSLVSVASPTFIRLVADTIRSTLTITKGEGIEEVNPTGSIKVGYFDKAWFTIKTRDGYHTPKVVVGSAYKDVKKGVGGVDTVFLGTIASNATVNVVAFRNNTTPVLYDIQVTNAAATPVVVNATANSVQLLKNPVTALPYGYVKFDVTDAVKENNYDKITLRLAASVVQFSASKELQLQWVSNNLNDTAALWDNSNFIYAKAPAIIKDTVSLVNVVSGVTAVEFVINDAAIIAQIKDSIAGGSKQLSFRISPNTTATLGMVSFYSSEGSTGDILTRTPQLIFSTRTYNVVVENEARSSGLITLTSPSVNDTTYIVKHDSAFVLNFTVKKGYQPVVRGAGKLTGTPSITEDVDYTFNTGKVTSNDTIRLSADVIRFNVDVQTPSGHVTIVQPTGGSPYEVANDSSFTLSFNVDSGYIPTATVSSDPGYTLGVGDSTHSAYTSYAITLHKVSSNVTITIAADEADSVTVRLTKSDKVTVASPTFTGGAYKVARDSSLTLTFTVDDEAYNVSAVKVNGADKKDDWLVADGNNYTFTIPQLTASVSVDIETAIKQYNVVLIAADGVSIVAPEDANPHAVDHGSSLTVKVTLAAGYFDPVKLVRLDGSVINATEANGEYVATISNITADDSIRITADDGIRHITIRKDARVTLTGANTDTVQEARLTESFTVTFTVPAGYTPTVTLQDGGRITTLSTAGVANAYESEIGTVTADATISITLAATTGIADVDPNDPVVSVRYYNLQGQEVRKPTITGIYILRRQHFSGRVTVVKRLVKADDVELEIKN